MTGYEVHATWSPRSGQWVLDCPEIDLTTVVPRLDMAPAKMAVLIEFETDQPTPAEDVTLIPHLPMSAEDVLAVARNHQANASKAMAALKAARQRAIADLQDIGLSIRDIGHLLGISHQRVAQIIKEQPVKPVYTPNEPACEWPKHPGSGNQCGRYARWVCTKRELVLPVCGYHVGAAGNRGWTSRRVLP